MKWKREAELDDDQSGFRQGKGTREGLLIFFTFSGQFSHLADFSQLA